MNTVLHLHSTFQFGEHLHSTFQFREHFSQHFTVWRAFANCVPFAPPNRPGRLEGEVLSYPFYWGGIESLARWGDLSRGDTTVRHPNQNWSGAHLTHSLHFRNKILDRGKAVFGKTTVFQAFIAHFSSTQLPASVWDANFGDAFSLK